MTCKTHIIHPPYPTTVCFTNLPSVNPHQSNRPLHYFSDRQACFCLMAQSFSPYIGDLYVASFLTYSRSLLTYHPSNNESIPTHSIMNFSCLMCIFPLFSALVFSIALITICHRIYFPYSFHLLLLSPHRAIECKFHKKKVFLSVLFTDISMVNEYNQQ